MTSKRNVVKIRIIERQAAIELGAVAAAAVAVFLLPHIVSLL